MWQGSTSSASRSAFVSTSDWPGSTAAVDENLTGFENLEMVGLLYHMRRRPSRDRADELLASFDLVEAGGRLVRTYSGGMRRRLDLAAALVARPPVLFLDEPTTGLFIRSRMRALGRDGGALVSGGNDGAAHDAVPGRGGSPG